MADSVFDSVPGKYDRAFNRFVYDAVPANGLCLDVGCWTGNLGARLAADKRCTVDGIEIDARAMATAGTRLRRVHAIDLNHPPLETWAPAYDCIICADVLEHLVDPARALRWLTPALKPGGRLILSVPNVAFVQHRVLLLLGIFEYNEAGGLMDAGHLRWFTARSLVRLVRACGYREIENRGYALVRGRYFVLRPLARIWPTLFALQFLLVARRPDGVQDAAGMRTD